MNSLKSKNSRFTLLVEGEYLQIKRLYTFIQMKYKGEWQKIDAEGEVDTSRGGEGKKTDID